MADLLEERYKHKLTDAEVVAASHLYMGGLSGSRGELCICPALTDYIGRELQKETLVMKERRKAGEERQLARPKKKGQKGGEGEGL